MYGYLLFVYKGPNKGRVIGGYQALAHAKNGAVHRGWCSAGDWDHEELLHRWTRGDCRIVRVEL